MDNLFSSLNQWAHRQEENFLTEAFVFLLNHLLENEAEIGKQLLNWLCFDNENHFLDQLPTVSTQVVTDEGRPDIRIQSPDIFVLIEVKKGSGLGDRQLGRYRKVLNSSDAAIRRLVLLTAFSVETDEDERPDIERRWSDMTDWLKTHPTTDSVSSFLVNQFLDFLKEQAMTIERVSWEYMNGIMAHLNLMRMVEKGLEQAQIPFGPLSSRWDYCGFYVDTKQFWIGVEFSAHEYVAMASESATYDQGRFNALDIPTVPGVEREILDNGKAWIGLNLEDESAHFFSRSAESQLALIREFMISAYRDMKACAVKSK